MKDKIIIFGGTFDPVHIGHLIMAQMALEFLNAKKVYFVPCFKSPHKLGYKLSDTVHRVNMLKISIRKNPFFELSLCEINRREVSYTYKTINWFKEKFINFEIYLLIGLDSLLEFTTWKNWNEIVAKVYILVGRRVVNDSSFFDKEKLHQIIPRSSSLKLNKESLIFQNNFSDEFILSKISKDLANSGKIIFFGSPRIEISSSQIRQRVRTSLSIANMVVEKVEEYIKKNRLYK